MSFMLTKEQQAYTYDEGYFYPGPAVKDVPLSWRRRKARTAIKEFGRPEYEKRIAGQSAWRLPLQPDQMVVAFRMWDEQVGGAKAQVRPQCDGKRLRDADRSRRKFDESGSTS